MNKSGLVKFLTSNFNSVKCNHCCYFRNAIHMIMDDYEEFQNIKPFIAKEEKRDGKIVINVNKWLKLEDNREVISLTNIDEAIFMYNGKEITLPEKDIKDWNFIGFTLTHFITMKDWDNPETPALTDFKEANDEQTERKEPEKKDS